MNSRHIFSALIALTCLAISQSADAMYHTRLGRFIQRDPLGYVDGLNAYAGYHILHGGLDPSGLTVIGTAGGAAIINDTWPNSKWSKPCFCPHAYKKCVEEEECLETYELCRKMASKTWVKCRDGAKTAYRHCLGSCLDSDDPSTLCLIRIRTCGLIYGTDLAICASAYEGFKIGCELSKGACEVGCHIGATIQVDYGCPCPEDCTEL